MSDVTRAVDSASLVDAGAVERGGADQLERWGKTIERYRGELPISLVATRIWVESRGNPKARVPHTGETGLLQLWPHVAARYNVSDATDPEQNIRAGCAWWLHRASWLHDKFSAQWSGASVDFWGSTWLAQSIGPGAVQRLILALRPRRDRALADLVAAVQADPDVITRIRTERQADGHPSPWGTQPDATVARRVITANIYTAAAHRVERFDARGNGGQEKPMSAAKVFGLAAVAGIAGALAYVLTLRVMA